MKHLIIIILFPVFCRAQDTILVRKHPVTQLLLIGSSVIASGIGDGLNSRTIYTAGHFLSAYSYAALLAIPFTGKVDWRMPVAYILLRYALFDLAYNYGAHRKWNYEGGKNYYDESVGRMPLGVLNGTKIVSFGIVIYLYSHKK